MHNQQHPCRLLLIGQYKSTPQNQALLLQEFILLLAASRTNEPPYLRAPIGPLFTKAAERGYTLVEVAGLLGTSMCLALRAVHAALARADWLSCQSGQTRYAASIPITSCK